MRSENAITKCDHKMRSQKAIAKTTTHKMYSKIFTKCIQKYSQKCIHCSKTVQKFSSSISSSASMCFHTKCDHKIVCYHSSTLRFCNSGRLSSRNKWRYSLGHILHSPGSSMPRPLTSCILMR